MASRDRSSPADRRKNPSRKKADRRRPGAARNETVRPEASRMASVNPSDDDPDRPAK